MANVVAPVVLGLQLYTLEEKLSITQFFRRACIATLARISEVGNIEVMTSETFFEALKGEVLQASSSGAGETWESWVPPTRVLRFVKTSVDEVSTRRPSRGYRPQSASRLR
jgi:hypothetical protein